MLGPSFWTVFGSLLFEPHDAMQRTHIHWFTVGLEHRHFGRAHRWSMDFDAFSCIVLTFDEFWCSFDTLAQSQSLISMGFCCFRKVLALCNRFYAKKEHQHISITSSLKLSRPLWIEKKDFLRHVKVTNFRASYLSSWLLLRIQSLGWCRNKSLVEFH